RGGEFSSDHLRAFCRAEGIRQTFMLPASPQQNGIAERRIGMVMDIARTSMILAAAPHFLWPFAVQYAAHQLNLQPRVSLPETTPTLRWTGKVGDASVLRVWGSRAFVRNASAEKLSSRAIPYVFLGFPPDAPGWQFYHPTSGCVLSSQDVTFDESVSHYHPVEPVKVAVDSGAARGTEPVGAGTGGAGPGVAESEGAEPERVEPGGVAPGGAESGGAGPEGAEPERAESGGPPSVLSRREPLSPQRLHEWYARRCSRAGGATGPATGGASGAGATGGAAGARAAGGAAGAGAAGAASPGGAGAGGTDAVGGPASVGAAGGAGAAGPRGACTGGTGAAGAGGAAGVGAVGAGAVATGGAAGAGAAGGTGAGGAAGVVAGDPGAEETGADSAVSGGVALPRPYYVPLLQQVLGLPPSTGPSPPLRSPPPVQSPSQLQPASPLPGPSLYSGPTRGLSERREPESRPTSCESRPASPESRPESLIRARVPLLSPPASSLPDGPDPESDSLRAASPTDERFLASVVIDPSFESTAAYALVAELVDFATACRLDYAASLVAQSKSASVYPPSVGGECALGTDILEGRQEDFECFAAALPHLMSMLLAPEGDPDAPDIPTPHSDAEAIEGLYSSQWQAAMDTEMASWKSTGTYVDEVPPPGANIVSGMWIFRVQQPPGSPSAFKVRCVARGFSQRQGVDFFQTFSPTLKMATLRVLLHVAAQRDYELHSLDFSTAFLQGSLHEEIWLRRPPGFTRSFSAGTQWSLRRPVYGLRQAPREWHDTLRTTLAALGFAPSTADPSLFLRTDTTLPPFYVLVYVDDLVFATADTEALAHVKSELQKRHTCTDLGGLTSYVGLRITRDRAQRTITLTQSHMVQQVLQRFGFTYSSPQSTPLPTGHSLSAPPSDESVKPSGPHRKEHMDAINRVLRYLCSTSGMGLVLGGRARVVLTGHADASWADDLTMQRSSQGYTFSLGSGSVSWRSTRSSSVLSSSCEAEIYAGAMAAQELRWLTYLLTDLGEPPRSPPVLYADYKAMIALSQEHRPEHRRKHQRAAPAVSALPLQPARRPLAARPPPLQLVRRPLAARPPPLQPARRLLAARPLPLHGGVRGPLWSSDWDSDTCALPICGTPTARAARSLPACGQLAARLRPTCSSLQPVSRPSCSLRAATCSPLAAPCGPLAASSVARALPGCCQPYSLRCPFDMRLGDLQLYLLSDSRDSVSLFDHTSGASLTPPAIADSATRSQWLTRDAALRLAIYNHLPLAECAHFGQHRTARAVYDAVVARYSSPATAALGRLLLPYLFPELSAFATVEDLVTHLRTSDARYRSALQAEDHILALDPTHLIVDLLEQHLLSAKTSVVA
ncbi:unnamed protein product, partial [Closterium sp. NIES-53]